MCELDPTLIITILESQWQCSFASLTSYLHTTSILSLLPGSDTSSMEVGGLASKTSCTSSVD